MNYNGIQDHKTYVNLYSSLRLMQIVTWLHENQITYEWDNVSANSINLVIDACLEEEQLDMMCGIFN